MTVRPVKLGPVQGEIVAARLVQRLQFATSANECACGERIV